MRGRVSWMKLLARWAVQTIDPRRRLDDFARAMFYARTGRHLVMRPHLRDIFEALTRVVLGQTTRLIICQPPRSGKTEAAVRQFIPWALGNFPQARFIHTGYSHRHVSNHTMEAREAMRHWFYRELFPNVRISSQRSARDEFATVQGGFVYAVGAKGALTGEGAGVLDADGFGGAIIVDDILKAGDADSDVLRKGANDWFQTTLESRKNSPETPIIVVAQRLHEEDLPGWLLAGGNGEDWELLTVPAINDEGASFWEQRFPIKMLLRLERANPYVFAGQYLQSPTPRGGGDIKSDMIEIVDQLPAGLSWVRGWDLAGTTRKRSDYTAAVKLAIDQDGYTWIGDVERFKKDPGGVERRMLQIARMDGVETHIDIPQDPGQAGVAQKRNLSRLLNQYAVSFSTETGDKRVRAGPFAGQAAAGNVRMLRAPWNKEYLHELGGFPMGTYDDMVDATSRAYNKAAAGLGVFRLARA